MTIRDEVTVREIIAIAGNGINNNDRSDTFYNETRSTTEKSTDY